MNWTRWKLQLVNLSILPFMSYSCGPYFLMRKWFIDVLVTLACPFCFFILGIWSWRDFILPDQHLWINQISCGSADMEQKFLHTIGLRLLHMVSFCRRFSARNWHTAVATTSADGQTQYEAWVWPMGFQMERVYWQGSLSGHCSLSLSSFKVGRCRTCIGIPTDSVTCV